MASKRSIFEEVAAQAPPEKAAASESGAGLIERSSQGRRRAIRLWLVGIFVLMTALIALGGLTRLTDSGLSITQWKPVVGALPPMSAAAWEEAFALYRQIPEYALQNKGMSLDAFKTIYWWEWSHRLLARVIGFVWAAGFVGFALARAIPRGWGMRLLTLGILGGAQGAIGWWMVSSGLEGERLDVASYRLAIHLGLAFVILGLIAWYVMLLGRSEAQLLQARRSQEPRLRKLGVGLRHLSFVQILLGALVAGIDAGRAFPTWPDMNGRFFPADAFYVPGPDGAALPLWHAFFESPGLVQFMHRMAGYLLLLLGIWAWRAGRRSPHGATRFAFLMVFVMMAVQMGLGIAAALSAAHLHVALTHQLGAVVLWVLVLRAGFLARYPLADQISSGKIRGGKASS